MTRRHRHRIAIGSGVFAALLFWGWIVIGPAAPPSAPPATPVGPSCSPGDQAQYIYHPARLVLVSDCITVTGTVASVRQEADGDEHIRLTLDPQFANLVNAVNVSGQHGDLVVEPVCVGSVTQADAQGACAADHDPISLTGLAVGQHVRMSGRYVTDSQHGGWAEIHPLASWVVIP